MLYVLNEARRSGAPLSALETLEALAGSSVDIVVVIKRGGPLVRDFRRVADRVLVAPGGMLERLFSAVRWRGVPLPTSMLERGVARRVIRSIQPDAVYADTVVSVEYARVAADAGLPAIFHCRETEPTLSRFVAPHLSPILQSEVILVANSRTSASDLARCLDIQADGITVLYSPVDVTRVRALAQAPAPDLLPDDDAPLLVACGHVHPLKGPDLWIDVIARVLTHRQVRCVWLGDGPILRRMRRLVKQRGFDPHVAFLGDVPNPYPLFAKAAVVTVPSRYEPLSRVAIEAQALGAPVVAFDIGGLNEALGDAGILVPAEDTEAMAAAIVALLDDPLQREILGQRGRARVERFDVEAYRGRARSLVDEAIRGSPRSQE